MEKRTFFARMTLTLLAAACLAGTAGCAALRAPGMLPYAIRDNPDPQTVREALASYMVMADAMVLADPDDPDALVTAAKLYTLYAALFAEEGERARTLTDRAHGYARKALCIENEDYCGYADGDAEETALRITGMKLDEVEYLHVYATSWLAWMQARADDPVVLAKLPKVEKLLERITELDDAHDYGSAHIYLGIIKTLRPASLGGKPEAARAHFERAIKLGGGRNLYAKVEMAKRYCRSVYDRPLHDRLLKEVLDAPVEAEGFTLQNVLARGEAEKLLKSAEDYF